MLVTMATNEAIAAGGSKTFTYSANSVQKVLVAFDDADWDNTLITVAIGSTTIVNAVEAYALYGLASMQTNGKASLGDVQDAWVLIDLGNHICAPNEALYVTVQSGSAITAHTVSAIINEPMAGVLPLRITEYSDNTFVSPNNLLSIIYDAGHQAIAGDTTNIDIRNELQSSSPNAISACAYFYSRQFNDSYKDRWGLLNVNPVPVNTSYNYPTSGVVDRICTVEQMPVDGRQLRQATRARNQALGVAGS